MSEFLDGKPESYTNPEIRVRPAGYDDGAETYEIWVKSWMNSVISPQSNITQEDAISYINRTYLFKNVAVLLWTNDLMRVARNKGAYVATIGKQVVGFVANREDSFKRAMVEALYVDPDCQGQGVGRSLLSKALDRWGEDRDVYLRVSEFNERAIRFYENAGFENTNTGYRVLTNLGHGKSIYGFEMVRKAIV